MGPDHDGGERRAGGARMNDSMEHFVDRYRARRPDVVELATVVSLAVQIEPGLLRRARLELTPQIGVAAETDLWFSPLVESRSMHGFVLHPEIAAVLRERLALDEARLADAHKLVSVLHATAPPTLRLEEDVLFAALTDKGEEVGRLMAQALRTIEAEPERTAGIARWVDRAIPSLPQTAQDARAAQQLSAVAERVMAEPLVVGLQLTQKGVVISEPPEPGAHELGLGLSTPRLELRPQGAERVVVEIEPGQVARHRFDEAWNGTVEVATPDGRVARLTPGIAQERATSAGVAQRLIFCCDSVWNQPDEPPTATNVAKLSMAIADVDAEGVSQLTHYSPGFGTALPNRYLPGIGMARAIKDVYGFVVDQYEPGAMLYLLGGSRGATIARSLAGMIRAAGILRREHRARIDQAFETYRSPERDNHPQSVEAAAFRRTYCHPDSEIEFIGVFDTVGKLGSPTATSSRFHDVTLSRSVRRAFHAVALDERRGSYHATLWQQHGDAGDQVLEQRWFAGAHADVVGGSPIRRSPKSRSCGWRSSSGHPGLR